MATNREELEKQLHKKAEEAIEQLMKELPDRTDLTMTVQEDLIGEMGRDLMQGVMQEVAQREQVEPVEQRCKKCQMRMQKRGKRKRQVVTKRGEIELERQYYVCPHCGDGFFPPG